MAVLGSNIMIDLHVTPDTDVESVRGALQEQSRLHPKLAGELQRVVEDTTAEVLRTHDVSEYTLDVDLELVGERVPGAPRERIRVQLDVEGEDSILASVDEAIDAPERAQIADAAERFLLEHLEDEGLRNVVDTTVIVTPVQFR